MNVCIYFIFIPEQIGRVKMYVNVWGDDESIFLKDGEGMKKMKVEWKKRGNIFGRIVYNCENIIFV